MQSRSIVIPVILTAILIDLMAAVLYFAFVFPKTVAVWSDQGKELSVIERFLALGSEICVAHLPAFLAILIPSCIVSLVWLVKRINTNAENQKRINTNAENQL